MNLAMMEFVYEGKSILVSCIVCGQRISTKRKRFKEVVLEAHLHSTYQCQKRKIGLKNV